MNNLRKLFLLTLVVALTFAATLVPRATEAYHCYCITVFGECCECDPRTAKIECSSWCGC